MKAFQWGWTFKYPDLGVQVTGETINGPGDHGPQMVVPGGETVQITLTSDDVIHGFYVHDFNFSRYALPGVVNIFDLNVHADRHLPRPVHPVLRPLPLRDALQRPRGDPDAVQGLGGAQVARGNTLTRSAPATEHPAAGHQDLARLGQRQPARRTSEAKASS